MPKVNSLALDRIEDGIASLRISTDENPYVETWFVSSLAAAIESLRADETVQAVIVEGGSSYFSAGASRAVLVTPERHSLDPQPTVPCEYFEEITRILLSLPMPTVAAMAGHAIGGGFLLGLWCDMVVLAEESMYGANFMALGFTPGMGATAVLEEAIGAPLARELLFTGRLMKGRELKAIGGPLAYAVVPRAEVRSHAISIAREAAKVPREALVLLKQTLVARRREGLERALNDEAKMQRELFSCEETRLRIKRLYPLSNNTSHTEDKQ